MSACATQQEILELRDQIRNITQRVQNQLHEHPHAKSVIVVGRTGSGKSTLVNILSGKPFTVGQDNLGSFILDTNNPLPDFKIEHQYIAGTKYPCSWYDEDSQTVFWDCPGFGDPGGAQKEILNAFSIHQLFKPNTKILLVAPESDLSNDGRATGFLKLLNQVTGLFSENQQPELRDSFSVIVSKHQNIPPNIPGHLQQNILPLTQQDQIELTLPVRGLLQFLVAHPERIASFPRATTLGLYAPNMNPLRQAIHSSNYMLNPDPRIRLADNANIYIDGLGASLNNCLVEYMGNQGNASIINYCNHLINIHPGSVQQLRGTFRDLVRTLENLQHVVTAQDPSSFSQTLSGIFGNHFDVNDINQTIEQIKFFKGIRHNITYNTLEWIHALSPTIERIRQLTNTPEIQVVHNLLSVKGIIVGTNDVVSALQNHQQANRVDVFSLNKLFIDENLIKLGISLNLIAPNWKVVEPRVINISGVPGLAGANGVHGTGSDGQPGGSGGNGGNFYGKGKAFDGIDNLVINTNGGSGGRGGDGGNGANGVNGRNGDLQKVSRSQAYYHAYDNPNGDYYERWSGVYNWYEDPGVDGTPGHNGGRGGSGGLGGFAGSALIDGFYPWNPNIQNGAIGIHGNSGAGGQGGVHGKHCQGYILRASLTQQGRHGGGSVKGGSAVGQRRDADYTPITHQAPRGNAPNGNPGLGLNNVGQQNPVAIQPRDVDIINGYNIYKEQINNPNTAPFIKEF